MGSDSSLFDLSSDDLSSLQDQSRIVVSRSEDIEPGSGFLANRQEQTTAGVLIGSVRDILGAPQSFEEKQERASSNDFLGHVVADVLVMIPKFKAVKAGIARTALLTNPHDGLSQDPLALGSNFLEGAALNKVSRAVLPGSSLSNLTERYLGSGLRAESATHLSAGFGFGAVKSGFDSRTWLDENGELSVGAGLETMAKTGTAAALINLPAGLVGMRSARWSGNAFKANTLGPRAHSFLIGTTSGYTSGAVVGGIEAVKEGKSFSEILGQMNEAGLVGAGTGMLFMSAMPLEKPLYGDLKKPVQPSRFRETSIDMVSERSLGLKAREFELESAFPAGSKIRDIETIDGTLTSKRRKIPLEEMEYHPRDDLKLTDLSRRLTYQGNRKESFAVVPESSKGKQFSSFEEFAGVVRMEEIDTRVYKFNDGDTEIVVSESHARKLDQIRQMRLLAAETTAFDGLSPAQRSRISAGLDSSNPQYVGDSKTAQMELLAQFIDRGKVDRAYRVMKARESLARNADNRAALPEDIVAVIEELPNPGMVKRVVLSEGSNPNDVWTRQTYDSEFVSAATASRDGEITFYKPAVDFVSVSPGKVNIDGKLNRSALRFYADHEWSHLAHFADDQSFGLFKLAEVADLNVAVRETAPTMEQSKLPAAERDLTGTDKYFARTYARRDSQENWAVHMGEEFMSPEVADFISLTEGAPVRTTILARNVISNSKTGSGRNVFGLSLARRVQHTQERVIPEAQKVLEGRIGSGSGTERVAAAELLGHLGNKDRHVGMLLKVADDPASLGIRESVEGISDGFLTRMHRLKDLDEHSLADTAFDAARRLSTNRMHGEPDVSFLVGQVKGSKGQVRELALERLKALPDGDELVRFARLAGDETNMGALMEMLPKVSSKQAQSLVFEEIINLAKGSEFGSQFTTAFLVKTIRFMPSQRLRALEVLGDKVASDPGVPSKELEGYMLTLTGNHDKRVAARAEKLLHSMQESRAVSEAINLIDSGGSDGRIKGLRMAQQHKDRRLIAPALKMAVRGTPEEAALAYQVLQQFEWRLVRHEAGILKSDGVDFDTAKLRDRLTKAG